MKKKKKKLGVIGVKELVQSYPTTTDPLNNVTFESEK